jgi:hypothetical protein
MYAIVRINTFDESKSREATTDLNRFQQRHAAQSGYAGSLTVDLGGGRRLVVNLWETEHDATAGLSALRPEVERVLQPLMAAPSQLIGVGAVVATDLSMRR